MGQITNFPDDPRLKDLPDEIRKRYRGRSIPSPVLQNDVLPKPVEEFIVAKTIIPLNLSLTAGELKDIFLAASSWVVQAIAVSVGGITTSVTMIARNEETETSKTIPLDSRKKITLISGFEEINFFVNEGEILALTTPVNVTLVGSIELVQEGGKIIRTENAVPEGPATGNPV